MISKLCFILPQRLPMNAGVLIFKEDLLIVLKETEEIKMNSNGACGQLFHEIL